MKFVFCICIFASTLEDHVPDTSSFLTPPPPLSTTNLCPWLHRRITHQPGMSCTKWNTPPPLFSLRKLLSKTFHTRVCQTCDFSGLWFFPDFRICYKSPFASKCFSKMRSSHQGKNDVACIVSKLLASCLWGCGESVNPPQLNIQEVQGGFVL